MNIGDRIGEIKYKRSAACFFLPEERGEPNLETLAEQAGVKPFWINFPPGSNEMAKGKQWADMVSILCLERRTKHYLFEIQFLYSRLLDFMRPSTDESEIELEEEPYYPLVLTFRDACMALDPEAAIVTVLPQDNHRWIREHTERWVREGDADAFAKEAGLLYMNEALYRRWDYYRDYFNMPGEMVPTERGILFFHGWGRWRWVG